MPRGVEIPRRELFIGGQWVAPADNAPRLDVVNPATEEVIGSIPAGGPRDAQLAVEAATRALKNSPWTRSTGAYRAKFLRAIAQKVRPPAPSPSACSAQGAGRTGRLRLARGSLSGQGQEGRAVDLGDA